jgi:hypothetical protein
MAAKVRITNSRHFGDAYHDLGEVGGQSIWDCLENIMEQYPDIKKELFTGEGSLQTNVCILLNKKALNLTL